MPLVALAENGVTFWADPAEEETLTLLRNICAECIPLIIASWGLPLPSHFQVYVATHWSHLMLHAAPPATRVVNTLTLPLWHRRVERVWTFAAGLNMRYRGRPAMAVKPQRLWNKNPESVGRRLFVAQQEGLQKMRNIVCHEMTHVFCSHLYLPLWINEGLAMVTVDRFLQSETVQRSTLCLLRTETAPVQPIDYAELATATEDKIAHAYAHGYWTTRYLYQTNPDLLRHLLTKRRTAREIENELARALDLPPKTLWPDLTACVSAYFAPEVQ